MLIRGFLVRGTPYTLSRALLRIPASPTEVDTKTMCACAGTKTVVTVGIAADSRLSVGLDPASDGLGGVDHEVLLDGELGMNIQITDKIKVR